jgi:hypothetical protein
MTWHIRQEIESYLRDRSFCDEIVNIVVPGGFAA